MTIKLVPLLETFVAGKNNHDSAAVLACFANNAVVYDEGQKLMGLDNIKRWLDASNEKYSVTLDPIKLVNLDNETILTAQVSGNFPGSPVPLGFHFIINAGKISQLSIRLMGE